MQPGLKVLSASPLFKWVRQEMVSRYGEASSSGLWDQAAMLYEKLRETYKDDPKKVRFHTEKNIFIGVALYKTLMKEHPLDAMPIMQAGMKTGGLRAAKTLAKLMRLPGSKHLFIGLFPFVCKNVYGPASGFQQKFYLTEKHSARMDILKCPYCKYCLELGCPELTPLFCENDDYVYGNVSGIRFTRTQTLGKGGDRCDFLMERY